MVAPSHVTAGTVVGGDFKILEPLRSGGMGAVYIAEQQSTGKRRALKLMHADLVQDPKLRERFEQEAKVGGLIASDHVVEVIGAGIDSATNMPWIAMELLEGEDLAHWVHEHGAPPLDQAREILAELCHAVGAAHEAGVVHRDLKPENVFLARARTATGKRTVKVLDFGIAKLVAHARTKATAAVGTPAWMAPEQTDPRAAILPAADVWALGLVTFWLLTGRPYWLSAADPTSSVHAMMREILFEPFEAASLRARDKGAPGRLPRDFDGWFSRCLTREPAARFANAAELFAAFRALGPVDADGAATSSVAMPLPAETTDPMSTRSYLASTGPGSSAPPATAATVHAPTEPGVAASTAARPIPAPTLVAPQLSGTSAPTVIASDAVRPAATQRRSAVPFVGAAIGAAGLVALFVLKPWASGGTQAATVDSSAAPAVTIVASASTDPPAPASAASGAPASPRQKNTGSQAATAPDAKTAAPRQFDRAQAQRTVDQRMFSIRIMCKNHEGPRAIAATITFKPTGTVQSVQVDKMSGTGFCVSNMLNSVSVPAFDGPPQSVGVAVSLDEK